MDTPTNIAPPTDTSTELLWHAGLQLPSVTRQSSVGQQTQKPRQGKVLALLMGRDGMDVQRRNFTRHVYGYGHVTISDPAQDITGLLPHRTKSKGSPQKLATKDKRFASQAQGTEIDSGWI